MLNYSLFSYKHYLFIIYFTPLSDEKFQLEPLYTTCGKKGLSARVVAKEIYDMEIPAIVKLVVGNLFRHFKESDTSLKDKPGSKKPIVEDEALVEMVKQQPSTITYALLAELGPSPAAIGKHLHSLWNKYKIAWILQNFWFTLVIQFLDIYLSYSSI